MSDFEEFLKGMCNMTIGKRAYQALKNSASSNGRTVKQECDVLGICDDTALRWYRADVIPGGYVLSQMLKNGYDVIYILSGEPEMNTGGGSSV